MLKRNIAYDSEISPPYILNAKHIMEKEAKDYMNSIKILYFTISFIFIILAVFNYFNVIYTSLSSRRKELVVLESVGMTRMQLRTLLINEGLLYSVIVITLMLSVGTAILYAVNYFIQAQRSVITFTYPIVAMIALMLMIVFISISLPLLIYKKVEKESVINRLGK